MSRLAGRILCGGWCGALLVVACGKTTSGLTALGVVAGQSGESGGGGVGAVSGNGQSGGGHVSGGGGQVTDGGMPDAGGANSGAAGAGAAGTSSVMPCLMGDFPVRACDPSQQACGSACGNQCVDLSVDAVHCGACGVRCPAQAGCNAGSCGAEPDDFVAPLPGCLSLRLAEESGILYWSDLGHGVLGSRALSGGAVTTLASGLQLGVVQGPWSSLQGTYFPLTDPPPSAEIVVDAGTVFFVAASETVQQKDVPNFLCHNVDGQDVCAPDGPPTRRWVGAVGTSIFSVSTGAEPRALLPEKWAPGPSPVSSALGLEAPDLNPPIQAITLSLDSNTLYFAAGTRFYSIPSSGAVSAADVKEVGRTRGPEADFADALASDAEHFYYSTGDHVETFDFVAHCSAAEAAFPPTCPARISGSLYNPLLVERPHVQGHFLYFAESTNLWQADLSAGDLATTQHTQFAGALDQGTVTSVAVGDRLAYFAEAEGNSGWIERALLPPEGSAARPPEALARAQSSPSSLIVRGKSLYFATADCHIKHIEDALP